MNEWVHTAIDLFAGVVGALLLVIARDLRDRVIRLENTAMQNQADIGEIKGQIRRTRAKYN